MAGNQVFKKINSDNRELVLIQKNVEEAVSQFIKAELLNGRLIAAQALLMGANTIEHKLNRKPKGYMIVSSSVATTFSDDIATAATSTVFVLSATAATTASLWVF